MVIDPARVPLTELTAAVGRAGYTGNLRESAHDATDVPAHEPQRGGPGQEVEELDARRDLEIRSLRRKWQVAACSWIDDTTSAEKGVVPLAVDRRAILPWAVEA